MDFSNILNFNYKFKSAMNESIKFEDYDNIKIQTDTFSDIESFQDFIHSITGPNTEAMELNIDTEKFLTYSYVCIDQEAWNPNNSFDCLY